MKDILTIGVAIFGGGILLLLAGFAISNPIMEALGIALFGIGGSILGAEAGLTAKPLFVMWLVLAVIIVAILGVQNLPIKFNFG